PRLGLAGFRHAPALASLEDVVQAPGEHWIGELRRRPKQNRLPGAGAMELRGNVQPKQTPAAVEVDRPRYSDPAFHHRTPSPFAPRVPAAAASPREVVEDPNGLWQCEPIPSRTLTALMIGNPRPICSTFSC